MNNIQHFFTLTFTVLNASEKGKEPFEGSVRPATSVYKRWRNEEKSFECDGALIQKANLISRYDRIKELGVSYVEESDSLPELLARKYGTVAYVYEPNMRTGPDGCMEKGVKVLTSLTSPFM